MNEFRPTKSYRPGETIEQNFLGGWMSVDGTLAATADWDSTKHVWVPRIPPSPAQVIDPHYSGGPGNR